MSDKVFPIGILVIDGAVKATYSWYFGWGVVKHSAIFGQNAVDFTAMGEWRTNIVM